MTYRTTLSNQQRQQRSRDLQNVCTTCGGLSYMRPVKRKRQTRYGSYLADHQIKICTKCDKLAKECNCI